MAFQSLKKFEYEVVWMTAGFLYGDKDVVGVLTSGGTESCLLPVITYRDLAESKRGLGGLKPEMIVPESVRGAVGHQAGGCLCRCLGYDEGDGLERVS